MSKLNISQATILYFISGNGGRAYTYINGMRETDKAVCFEVSAGDLWIPKAALQNPEHQPTNIEVRPWFKFTGYGARVFSNSAMPL